ncbi:hypothetical protein DL765_003046 [Monosporascus sp. GIB2]|nr:hypothetical protein DL765_003046 [Monosporascus sp. GIB2]
MASSTEDLQAAMEYNLPELLAVDLEQSRPVFQSKQLTSGIPLPCLSDDGSRRRYSLQDMSLTLSIPPHHRHDHLFKANSLRALNQGYLRDLTLNKKWDGLHKEGSDSETTSSESSGCMEPQSARTAGTNVTTPPRSVASEQQPSPRPRRNSMLSNLIRAGISWMDLDEDEPESTGRSRNSAQTDLPTHTAERRGNMGNPRSESLGAGAYAIKASKLSRGDESSLEFFDTSETADLFGSPAVPDLPVDIPNCHSSLGYAGLGPEAQLNVSPRLPLSTSYRPEEDIRGIALPHLPTSTTDDAADLKGKAEIPMVPSKRTAFGSEGNRKYTQTNEESASKVIVPLDSIETWLESMLDVFTQYSHTAVEGPASRLPLPSRVMDTLRISVSSFPETMLSCSSLSIETIRSHSRRLKTPRLTSDTNVSTQNYDQAKIPKWRRTCKKLTGSGVPSSRLCESPVAAGRGVSLEGAAPDWAVVKSVFPAGTDFLCDALYAHLLAYNYITSLCPRASLTSTSRRPQTPKPPAPEQRNPDGSMIPHKAASFFGLPSPTSPTTALAPEHPPPVPPARSALRQKKSFMRLGRGNSSDGDSGDNQRATTKVTWIDSDSGTAPTSTWARLPRSAAVDSRCGGDQALRDLQDLRIGLAKCVARLVATLRLASCGRVGDGPLPPDQQVRIDPLFMRALSELVRCNEERQLGVV